MFIECMDEQARRVNDLERDIATIERRLSEHMRKSAACKTLAEIPGVGLMMATAVVSTMGTPTAFKNAREFAAWIGLVPRQAGTGGRVRELGISKRGDVYLRTLLMPGARSIVRSDRSTSWPWLSELLKRRPYSVVVAAVANKLARTIWAVLARAVRNGVRKPGRLPDPVIPRTTVLGEQATNRVMGQTSRTGTGNIR
jgi:transposase